MEKFKKFLKKGEYTKVKLVIAIIVSFLIAIVYTITRPIFVVDRIFLVGGALAYLFMHFIFKLERMYNWIYKFRYYIALSALLVVTIFEYSGSSMGVYNEIMQGETVEKYFTPVLGKYRSIRSDEWVVNTPIFISQAIDKENPFGYYNNNLRGTTTDMFSIISPAVNDILILGKPFNIGYLLLGPAKGLAIAWYGKWIALALVAFEFCMLITDKKKLISLLGMLLIIFSAASQWWNMPDYFLWGMLAIVLIDKFLRTDKIKTKIYCAFGIFISAISFVFIMYPAWQIPFIYIYFAVFISLCAKNRKVYKFHKKDALITLLVILAIGGIGFRYLNMSSQALQATMNTDYPGQRFEIGGDGLKNVYSYVYSFLFPYTGVDNPCEFSGMISFYPIPMILAIIYLIRNKDRKKHLAFLVPMLFVATMFSIFTLCQTSPLFAKLTFLYMTPGRRLAVPLGLTQILLLVYILGITNKDTKILKESIAKIVAIVLSVFIYNIAINTAPPNLFGSLKAYCCGLILFIFIYWLLTINKEENKNKLIIGLIIMALMTGATVNPIQKGISVLTDKPAAKAVQQIVNEDPENNMWMVENTNFYFTPNYFLASGAKIINSVNIYPNFDLYKIVLGEDADKEENRKIYNRYAHLAMEITEDTNSVETIFEDSIRLKLTADKLEKLGIKYIIALRDLRELNTKDVSFEMIYNEQGISMYKVIYN